MLSLPNWSGANKKEKNKEEKPEMILNEEYEEELNYERGVKLMDNIKKLAKGIGLALGVLLLILCITTSVFTVKQGSVAIITRLEMYFKSLPDIAKNVAEPLKNIDKITMYGEGNNTKLVGDITKSITQISDGLNDSLGVDVKSILAGALGHKLLSENKKEIEVNVDKDKKNSQRLKEEKEADC